MRKQYKFESHMGDLLRRIREVISFNAFHPILLLVGITVLLLVAFPRTTAEVAAQGDDCTYDVSITGSDPISGFSATQTWSTFSYTPDQLLAGDTICISDGTYYQSTLISTSATETNPIPTYHETGTSTTMLSTTDNAGTEHLFEGHSTWYEKIPDNPQIMEHSDDYINDVMINNNALYINYRDYGVPIWYADEDTEYQFVTVEYPQAPDDEWYMVPIPAEAKPTSGNDHHMVIVSYDLHYAWDFWHAQQHSDGHWSTETFRRWDLTSDGINSPYDGYGSCRVSPVPLLHGLMTYDEIINKGNINHAISFAYWGQRTNKDSQGNLRDNDVYPCEKANAGVNEREWALWLGFRLQLDPSLTEEDFDRWGLNWSAKIIAKALQEYGMIFVENCGVNCNAIHAEILDDKPESWSDIFDGSITKIPLEYFRVIEPLEPPFDFSVSIGADPSSGPAPLEISLASSISGGTSPYTYSWNFGDGNTSNEGNPSHTYTTTGNFIATLTVTDNAGEQASDSITIQVADPDQVLSISDIRFTSPGQSQALSRLESDTWYDLYIHFNSPNGWGEIAFTDLWLSAPSYTEGTIENRGGPHYAARNYVLSYSIAGEGIWAKETEGTETWSNITGLLGRYVDDDQQEYEQNSNEGWAKARVMLLGDAEAGTWKINAYVKEADGDLSQLYSEEIAVESWLAEDVNQDGSVNGIDVQLCVNVLTGQETDPVIVQRADINNDSVVDASDIEQIVRMILGS